MVPLSGRFGDPAHRLPDLKVGEMYAEVAEYTKAGDFWDFIGCNITLGQKASLLWAVNAGRFFQTAGLFLLGFYIGRKRLFCVIRKEPSSVGKDIDCFRSFLCTFIYVEGTGYGTGRYRTANRGYCI